MTHSRRAVLAASGALLVSRVARADGAGSDVLARIAKARASVRSLQGPFTQKRTIGLLATEVRSHGTLALVRPDRLRWELAPPDSVTFWVGPEGIAYRSEHGHGRLSVSGAHIAAALDDLRTLLGGDLSKLQERWSIRVLRDDASGAELEATARTPASGGIRTMRFALAADLIRPTRTVLIEGTHDTSEIEFGESTVNAPIDEAVMRPPAG
jgi:hypothetical protein